MSLTVKLLIGAALLLASYAFGRFTAPEHVRIETKVVTVESKTEDKQTNTDRDKHRESTVTEVVKPDGTKEITTKTIEDTKTDRHTETKLTDDIETIKSHSEEVTHSSSKVTVSLLAGLNVREIPSAPLIYGGSITRPVLGPLAIGIFALTSGVAGLSVGLTF